VNLRTTAVERIHSAGILSASDLAAAAGIAPSTAAKALRLEPISSDTARAIAGAIAAEPAEIVAFGTADEIGAALASLERRLDALNHSNAEAMREIEDQIRALRIMSAETA
jgi:hypothetical protein